MDKGAAVHVVKYNKTKILTGEDPASDTDTPRRHVTDEEIKFALFGGDGHITDAMYDEVKRFAAFIKMREADK